MVAAVDAESVQHISTNLFGDPFRSCRAEKDGHEVPWLLIAQVDFSFEQEASWLGSGAGQ